MLVSRTHNISEVDKIFKNPDIRDMLCDDAGYDVEYPDCKNIYYLSVRCDGNLAGMFMLYPINMITLDVHVGFLPEFHGKGTLKSGLNMIDWVKDNTIFKKINACIPEYNKACINLAKNAGFKKEGVSKASFLKNGVACNQVYMGRSI